MSTPAVSPIPVHVALHGQLLIHTAYLDAAAYCRAQGAVCVAVELRTALVHRVSDVGTWNLYKGCADFYAVPTRIAARYEGSLPNG